MGHRWRTVYLVGTDNQKGYQIVRLRLTVCPAASAGVAPAVDRRERSPGRHFSWGGLGEQIIIVVAIDMPFGHRWHKMPVLAGPEYTTLIQTAYIENLRYDA